MPQVIYTAGPMTGLPQFNYPAFDSAATTLRRLGWDVVSPAELDDPDTRRMALASKDGSPGSGAANGETWGDFLSRDVKLISDEVDAVAVLPGWEESRGARLEVFVARICGKPVFRYAPSDPTGVILISDDELNETLDYGDPGIPERVAA